MEQDHQGGRLHLRILLQLVVVAEHRILLALRMEVQLELEGFLVELDILVVATAAAVAVVGLVVLV